MCWSLECVLRGVLVEEKKKIQCDLLDGIWKVVIVTLGWLSYLLKGSIFLRNGEV